MRFAARAPAAVAAAARAPRAASPTALGARARRAVARARHAVAARRLRRRLFDPHTHRLPPACRRPRDETASRSLALGMRGGGDGGRARHRGRRGRDGRATATRPVEAPPARRAAGRRRARSARRRQRSTAARRAGPRCANRAATSEVAASSFIALADRAHRYRGATESARASRAARRREHERRGRDTAGIRNAVDLACGACSQRAAARARVDLRRRSRRAASAAARARSGARGSARARLARRRRVERAAVARAAPTAAQRAARDPRAEGHGVPEPRDHPSPRAARSSLMRSRAARPRADDALATPAGRRRRDVRYRRCGAPRARAARSRAIDEPTGSKARVRRARTLRRARSAARHCGAPLRAAAHVGVAVGSACAKRARGAEPRGAQISKLGRGHGGGAFASASSAAASVAALLAVVHAARWAEWKDTPPRSASSTPIEKHVDDEVVEGRDEQRAARPILIMSPRAPHRQRAARARHSARARRLAHRALARGDVRAAAASARGDGAREPRTRCRSARRASRGMPRPRAL